MMVECVVMWSDTIQECLPWDSHWIQTFVYDTFISFNCIVYPLKENGSVMKGSA